MGRKPKQRISLPLRVRKAGRSSRNGPSERALHGAPNVDTPSAQVRSTASSAGVGSLTFAALTIGLVEKLEAASANIALLDNGPINDKDLKHGIFEIVTKEAHPRHIFVDDPAITLTLRFDGGELVVQQAANS